MKSLLTAGISCAFLFVFSIATMAGECQLSGIQGTVLRTVKGDTIPTDKTNFRWSSVILQQAEGVRRINFIQNRSEKPLSATWEKGLLVLPFGTPGEPHKVYCVDKYLKSPDSYELDNDAPIRTSNDGDKGAQAFVEKDEPTPITEISMTIEDTDDQGRARHRTIGVTLEWISGKGLHVEFTSTAKADRIGIALDALGVNEDIASKALSTAELDFKSPQPLSSLLAKDEIASLGLSPSAHIYTVSPESTGSIVIEKPTRESAIVPIVFMSESGQALFASRVEWRMPE